MTQIGFETRRERTDFPGKDRFVSENMKGGRGKEDSSRNPRKNRGYLSTESREGGNRPKLSMKEGEKRQGL